MVLDFFFAILYPFEYTALIYRSVDSFNRFWRSIKAIFILDSYINKSLNLSEFFSNNSNIY